MADDYAEDRPFKPFGDTRICCNNCFPRSDPKTDEKKWFVYVPEISTKNIAKNIDRRYTA